MSKVIRNIATQRPVWTSQPSMAVGVDEGLAPIVAFNAATMMDSYSGKPPSIPSLNGITWVIASRGKALELTGVGAGQILVPCKDTASFTAIFVGALSGSATGLHRPFSTYSAGTGHDVYYDGAVLYIQDYYSGGVGVWQFPYAYSSKVITLVISLEVGTNLLKYPVVFIDGVRIVGSEVFPRIGTRLAGQSILGIGCRPDNTGHQLQGQVNAMGWLPYAVSDSVARDLSRNPWQIFQPLARQVPFDLVRGPTEPRQSYMMGTTAPEVSTAMPAAILKTPWTRQPQGVVPALRNGVKASSIFVPNASLYGALHSTHFIGVGAGGRELVMPYFPTQRMSAGHGNVSFSAEWTIVCVYRRNAEGIGWSRAFSAGSESATSAVFGLAYGVAGGSFGQLYIVVSGSNASSVGSYSPTDTDPVGVVSVQVFTCKGGVVTSWKNGGLKLAGVAANIGSVNAGQMYLGCQVAAQSGGFSVLGLLTLPYGLSDRDGRDLSANPWQIFAPQSKQIWVAP